MIKAIFSASPTNMTMAQALQWDYNPSLISIPVFLYQVWAMAMKILLYPALSFKKYLMLFPILLRK